MYRRYIPSILMLIVCASFVTAAGLTAHSPLDEVTIDPKKDGFSFTTSYEYIGTEVTTCRLYIDGAVHKEITINDQISGKTRRFSATLEEGEYEWVIRCTTEEGLILTSPIRTVNVSKTPQSPVIIESSGVTRGSMRRSFTMRNSPDQEVVIVEKAAPGDYVSITIDIPPSLIEKEYFYKGRYTVDGRSYLKFDYKSERYELFENENTTLDLSSSAKVIAQFAGMELNRATILFYPYIAATPPPKEPAEEPLEEPELPEEPEEPVVPEQPPELPEEPEAPPREIPEEPTEETTPQPVKERQGFFSWALSLLAKIFGA